MFNIGDIIIRTANPYKQIRLGTRGQIIERRPINRPSRASQVLVLDGGNSGETHTWADEYVTLEWSFVTGEPDWEI
jgi:hypothetical protein